MERKKFIVELGTGIDLHRENVTLAACRAVNDAISDSCLFHMVVTPEENLSTIRRESAT